MGIESWLARAARNNARGPALITPDGDLTYAELLDRSLSGAAALRDRGVNAGDHVAVALPPGRDFAIAMHSCLLAGAAVMPVDLRLSSAEQTTICATAATIVDEPLIGHRGPRHHTTSRKNAPLSHDLDATAAVIHTSGTTSTPKPVALTYANLLWSAIGSAVALGLDPRERWLCALPVSHVGGLSILVRSTIYATTAVIHPRFDTDRVLEDLRSNDITLISVVATTLTRLLDAGLKCPSSLRCALAGGGPVPPPLLARAADSGVPVSQTYGLTETSSQATTTPIPAIALGRPSAGPPLFCTRLRIDGDGEGPEREPRTGETLEWETRGARAGDTQESAGHEGEIMISGPTVAPAAAGPDGWLATGDLGRIDELGHLHVTGRRSDTIISGGENISPSEVEAALEAHPGVHEAAVVAREDPRWGEAVTAIVVTAPGPPVSERALAAHCAEHLAAYKVPKRFVLTADPLPRTHSGKLLRRKLR